MTDPDPLQRLVPELTELRFPDEALAPCASCSMAPRPHARSGAIAFTARARCCTYHPTLPNWLAGRALRRTGPGAELVAARIRALSGVGAMALGPGPEATRAWKQRSRDAFGRDETLTCPFWIEGPLGCSIHADRNAVCRTWFCKVERGGRGAAAWTALKTLRTDIEHRLAERCVGDGAPPKPDAAADAWLIWYGWCADHVDTLVADDLAGPRLDRLVQRVRQAVVRRDAPMPDVLRPMLHDWQVHDDAVLLASWSPYDRLEAPPWVFTLLAELDGERTWREAVDSAAEALGHAVPDEWVWHLWARGLLEGPDDGAEAQVPSFDVLSAT